METQYQYQPNGMHPASNSTALVERNEMAGTSLAHTSDQVSVLSQQAIAAVQARYVLALNRPRNLDYVRQRILHECHRPTFARVAKYTLPFGEGVSGPTIRFAEMVIRNMGNLYIENMLISDTPETRVVRVVVTDLETNASYYKDITIAKTVERSSLRKNQTPIKTRHNSLGKIVYIVEASEGDLLSKEAAQVSKAIRTCALRLIPGDILEEALNVVEDVLNSENAKDPDAARKKIVDTFAQKGITAEMLAKYLGMNDLSAISPQQITHLQGVYYTISDGEAAWTDIYAASPYRKADEAESDEPERSSKAAALQKQIEEKLAAKKKKKPEAGSRKPEAAAPAENPSPDLSQGERNSEPQPSNPEPEEEEPSEPPITNGQKQKIERLAQILYPGDWQQKLNELRGSDSYDGFTENDGWQMIDELNFEADQLKKGASAETASDE